MTNKRQWMEPEELDPVLAMLDSGVPIKLVAKLYKLSYVYVAATKLLRRMPERGQSKKYFTHVLKSKKSNTDRLVNTVNYYNAFPTVDDDVVELIDHNDDW